MGNFPVRLAALLKAKGLKQVDAARVLGESQANVSRWLSGANEPTLTKAVEIAARLGVPVTELTGEVPSEISKIKAQVGRCVSAAHQIDQLPAASLKKFRNRFRAADPDLRNFMSAQVRALFGPDAKKILAWLNAP